MKLTIKTCGLKSAEIVAHSVENGADQIGFIFFEKSPRHVTVQQASDAAVPARGKAEIVAVSVNASDEYLDEIVTGLQPDMLQLHGKETPDRVAEVKHRYGLPVMKAFSIQSATDLDKIKPYIGIADRMLFDAKAPKNSELPGGNGVSFDWTLLDTLDPEIEYMLSGGLNTDNVGIAIESTNAFGLDLSSGIESSPGVKDKTLMTNFFQTINKNLGHQAVNKAIGRTALSEQNIPNSYREGPDEDGRFGIYGGRFVAETLMPLILDLQDHWEVAKSDPTFKDELEDLNKHYTGRPSPLYFAERLTEELGGAKIYFKRDELNHTGSHKINNCLGQILLAKRMGKKRIIAETGAGQHGVASATVAARFGLPCVVYMGAKDIERQAPNVFRMKLLGAEVIGVTAGNGTLKDAMNEALRDWVTNVDDTYYIIGTAAGPHPYPEMVRDFQSVIGMEAKEQMMEREGRLPDMLVAAVGGGSNAIGLFHPFLDDKDVKIVGVEAGGKGLDSDEHCASLTAGSPGVLHGNRTYLLQDDDGQIEEGHSISAGLDYPGIGPEHSWLRDTGRVEYVPIMDHEALEAFQLLTRLEGIIPALEPSHALAEVMKRAPKMGKDQIIVMNLCGRGDKDVFTVGKHLGVEL